MTYRVCHGYCETNWAEFTVWKQALDFAREMRRLYQTRPNHTVSIYNTARADQDSYGLTDAEREEWEHGDA